MLASGLPEQIGDGEDIARFLLQSNQFTKDSVKAAAFLPCRRSEDEPRLETSVSRHGSHPPEELWKLGEPVAVARNRTLYGAGILKARDIRETHLDVIADELPLRHAVIIGWPCDQDPEIQKARQKEMALVLASKAVRPVMKS